jgi:group I intron endonuclease
MQIYKITNKINGKVYVGKDESSRINYYGSGKNIRAAIKKYGIDNFEKEILEDNISDKILLQEKEKFWILECNSINPKIGYNISAGGDGGDTISRNPNKDDIIKKISNTLKGRVFSEEHKNNLKLNHNSKNPEVGKKISKKLKGVSKTEDHKKKLAIASFEYNKKIGRWVNEDNPMKKYKYNWYSNVNTGKCKRIKEGDTVPENYVLGRNQIKGSNNPMNKK